PAILMVCSVFMILAAINFSLHFLMWREKSLRHYLADAEMRFFMGWIIVGSIITVVYLASSRAFNLSDSFYLGIFNFVSTMTTAGFASDYNSFPSFLPYMLFLFAFIGGCASSTGGGMKAIRVLLLYKQGVREIHRLIHPSAVLSTKGGEM